ncbi:MAG: fibronectin type III domain-containing protein [Clostridia bacterium]|nr:fibronectin type III domain-containing protein [Clostridia bacterium]
MKKILKNKKGMLLTLIISVMVCLMTAAVSFAAEEDFEKKIAAFPESYKPYLRQLHQAHPSWEFEPFFTQLDFNASVDSELGAKSLVSSSSASELFKSKDIGDYNYSKNYYIEKDGGFVEANRLAVAYFMDPRNFLNEDGIFMFETLSFSESFTVEAVENVLKGSFMANKKITYYDKEGKLKKTSTKYATAIYDAGKKYNVNPCYLASKILNEVGTSGSSSVSGKHSKYPGVYNFYNIGAYDGANAIAKGLSWASEGTSYGRPWTTPVKSINGGAEYIASSYIAKGQFTGYLQRFNVNPNGYYRPYDHQYMTNLTGALSQGYSTYVSYVKSGLIDNKYVFSIPVYENMPSWTSTQGEGELSDGFEQTGKITADVCFVRTGPSTYHSQLSSASGSVIRLTKGEPVRIIDKVNTDSDYYLAVLQYPYWYKVNFTLSGVTYEGYVPATFVDVSTVVQVGIGEYEPSFITTEPEVEMHLVSYDAKIASVTPDNKIRFLKKGTVIIGAYDSLGNFDKVKYVVTNGDFVMPGNVSLLDIKSTSVSLGFIPSALAANYEVIAVDGRGSISHRAVTSVSPCAVTVYNSVPDYTNVSRVKKNSNGSAEIFWDAPEKTDNRIFIRAVIEDTPTSKKYGPVTCLYATSYIGGYEIYSYDSVNKAYTKLETLSPYADSYTVPKNKAVNGVYAVRAFGNVQGETVYGNYSSLVDMKNIPGAVSGIKLSDVTDSGYTLTWSSISGAKYDLYKEVNGVYSPFKTFSKATYKAKKQGSSAYTRFKLTATKTVGGILYEGTTGKAFSVTTVPSKIKNLKISATDVGGKLKWDKVPNATGYDIYIYKSKNKKFAKLASVTKNSYTITGRDPGKEYKIRVKAKIKTTYGTFKSESTELIFRTKPGKVKELKASSVKTASFTLNWEKTKATSRYYVYQYSSKKKKYVKVAEVKTPTYKVSGLKAGTTYKFKIKTVKLSNGKSLCSNTSEVFSFTTKPAKVVKLKASSRKKTYITLSWEKVNGADKYQIYRYDTKKKKYVRITTVEGKTKYKVTGLKAGTSYKFKVRAQKTLNGKKYYGSYSDIYTVKTKK